MKRRLQNFLGVEPNEVGPVTNLLVMSFFMGGFLATVLVAAQSQYLSVFDEAKQLPKDLMYAGLTALAVSFLFNVFVGRINFSILSIFFIGVMIVGVLFLMSGEKYVPTKDALYQWGFRFVLSFTFLMNLIFWGAFNRLFNLRQIKRVVGSVDVGMDIASIIAFFSIPVLLTTGIFKITDLYLVGLICVSAFLFFFIVLAVRYLNTETAKQAFVESEHKKLGLFKLLTNKYVVFLSLFLIVSLSALRFVDYSFFNVSTERFTTEEDLGLFLSLFEGTIVIFSFAFTTWATDRLQQDYGLRISLIINPLLLLAFTILAGVLGFTNGFIRAEVGESSVYFFIAIAMSKLFINSLRDALDTPVFKNYYIPIDKSVRVDAQAKLEGIITSLAFAIGGGLIVFINQFENFNLLSVTLFAIPIFLIWYFVVNQMYKNYRRTLNDSLVQNRKSVEENVVKEYTVDSILEKESKSTVEDKVIYGMKLMEKLQPALFETSVLQLANSPHQAVRAFAASKIETMGLNKETESEMKGLALAALGASEDSEMLSIAPDRLMKLSKSVKQADRVLATKMLRKLVSPKTIFILLELLRDADPKVRHEALITARKVKRPETWPVLIEMISSPMYGHHAIAALKEAGEAVLPSLDAAFHKSGQTDVIMMKLVQIMGYIGGREGMEMLWKKIDYPDKRIVRQIIYTLRLINYKATGKEAREIMLLLDVEIGKTMWNQAALDELPDDVEHFQQLREAIREEVRENFDQITLLLSLLYDPESVQLVRENVESGTPDGVAYAMELMELFVDADLKPKLYPLFDDMKVSDKLEALQTYFPRENYEPIQVINYIINRDFNYNNRWSKVCAVHASAYMNDFRVSRGLISQMFNLDKLLQETSAWVIYNKDKVYYQELTTRLPLRDKRFLDTSIENNQLLNGLDDGFFLGIEIVFFLKELTIFRGISGSVLSDLADKVVPIDLNTRDKIVLNNVDELPIIICAHGEIRLKDGDKEISTFRKGGYYGEIFQEGAAPRITEVEATERSVVFRINLVDFYYVMANHQELISGLIRNVTVKENAEVSDNE